jgi:hypothetical protein
MPSASDNQRLMFGLGLAAREKKRATVELEEHEKHHSCHHPI